MNNPMDRNGQARMASRRDALIAGAAAGTALALLPIGPSEARAAAKNRFAGRAGNTVTTKDGTEIYYKDWSKGPPVIFSHGWPLNADIWDDQMMFMASNGFRCVSFDRRGHGRSSQPWEGNEYDTFAEDMSALMTTLNLKGAILVGHSAGAGDIARYIGRFGTGRVARAVLVSAIPPLMLKTAANPTGVPIEVFDGIREGILKDRSQFYRSLGDGPFFGANRPGSMVSQGVKDAFWMSCMQVGLRASYEGIKAFSETDFTQDLRKFDVPTLIVHGEDDQNVPIANTAIRSSKLIRNATLKIYAGAPHGLTVTHKDKFNDDLLTFAKAVS